MMVARVNLTSELPRDLPPDALLSHGTFLINLEGEEPSTLKWISEPVPVPSLPKNITLGKQSLSGVILDLSHILYYGLHEHPLMSHGPLSVLSRLYSQWSQGSKREHLALQALVLVFGQIKMFAVKKVNTAVGQVWISYGFHVCVCVSLSC